MDASLISSSAVINQVEAGTEELKCSDIIIEERNTSAGFDAIYEKLETRITPNKIDCNTFGQVLRIFKPVGQFQPGFPTLQKFRQMYGKCIAALYIFKLHHESPEGYTHGIHVRLQGYVHRRIFKDLVAELLSSFTNIQTEIKAVVPVINKHVSLFDYLQTLYVLPHNLYVNFSHRLDAVAEIYKQKRVETHKTGQLKQKMNQSISQIIDTMIAMPAKYPQSYLFQTLSLDGISFKRHMRTTNINEIVMKVGQDAYNVALQDKSLKAQDVQELMEPLTRRAMLNKCINDKVTKHVQLLFQQTFSQPFVHPHPYNGIIKCDSSQLKPLDGLVFDPRFLFSLLLTSRWFLKACMLQDDTTSNNHAHLLLYGGAGTGKTLIVSSIASCVPTYKYLVTSRFQNPDLLQASLLTIDEFDTKQLVTNQYKALLDLKSHVKIDFKNLNPENVTEGMPCMMTTNDDVFTVLRNQRKQSSASVDAALRRLYMIPMKFGPFEKLHGPVPKTSQLYATLAAYDGKFESEQNKLIRIFNLILAFALFQQDATNFHIDKRLYDYFNKLVKEFASTAFGTFYIANKATVDQIISDVEDTMKQPDCDDATYLIKVSAAAGQFQQLINQFLLSVMAKVPGLDTSILRDTQCPWSQKAYYLLKNHQFIVSLMWEGGSTEANLNSEIRHFLQSPLAQKFASENSADDILEEIMDFSDVPKLGEKRTFVQMMGIEAEMCICDQFQNSQ